MKITISSLDDNLNLVINPASDLQFPGYNDLKERRIPGCLRGRKAIYLVPAMLVPVRTDCLKNFLKDFFLPSTLNRAIRVDGIVKKIFAIPLFFVLDVITFPVRLITCIPRMIYNSNRKMEPLKAFLERHRDPIGQQLALEEAVFLKIESDRTDLDSFTIVNGEVVTKWTIDGEAITNPNRYVRFIDVPGFFEAKG